MQKSKSFMLAAATAALFAGGLTVTAAVHAEEAKVHCSGINSCKGTGACGGAGHSCAGKNECKGKGWVNTSSAEECTKKGGKVVAN